MAKLVPAGAEKQEGLGRVQGWLEDDDPYFAILESVVAGRARHRPRALRTRRPSKAGR
jgi:hypothetical protein